MKYIRYLISISVLLFPFMTYAQESSMPPIPYEDHGACPFECCEYREWTTEKETTIHIEMRDDSPVAFKVKRGERVTGITGVVITTKPGQAKVLKSMTIGGSQAKTDDVVYLFTYLGEGFYIIWYKGKVVKNLQYMDEDMDGLKIITEPKSIWWVKIKNSKGQTGWSKQPSNFGNKDACA